MADKLCRFICDRHTDDSPARYIGPELHEKYVAPVVNSNFPDFTTVLFSYGDTPGLSGSYLDEALKADLVIADISVALSRYGFCWGRYSKLGFSAVDLVDAIHRVLGQSKSS